jgi:predicted nuclease of predicted toxin-antitoxin system
MRFLLDQGIPRDAAVLLRAAGHECTHVGEIAMSQAADEIILAQAVERGAVAVTLDADFHAMLAVSGARAPSVVRLRRQGLDAAAVAETIQRVIAAFSTELARGALVTVKEHKTTCHLLPIGANSD